MFDWFLILALTLMVLGIIGSFMPALPGPLLSILGVTVYFWSTGYAVPSPLIFTVIVLTGFVALVLDYVASYIGADKADASKKTAVAAAIASFLLFFISGPIGIIVGTGATVLVRELFLGKDIDAAFRSAVYTTVALLGSIFAKVGLTLLMLMLFMLQFLF